MAGQCVVFNSNISISCSCLCHPLYPKIQHARLFKVWNYCFLKQCILRSQEELWYFSWELSSLLHGVAFKLWEYWELSVIPVYQPKLTAAKLLWMPAMAREVPVYITRQELDAGNPVSAHSSCFLGLWGPAGLPQHPSSTVTQPPAAGSDLLLLLKPWPSPTAASPWWNNFPPDGCLRMWQDTYVKGIWKRSNHQKKWCLLRLFHASH